MQGRPTLTPLDVKLLDGLAAGEHTPQLAKRTHLKRAAVKQRIGRLCKLLDLDVEVIQRNWRVLLAQWWTSEIFRAGLEELGLLPGNRERAA